MAMHMQQPASGNDVYSGYQPMAEINVTPLVDVMLVLLIIFMVTAPLMMAQLPIELPKTSADNLGKPPTPLIVGMDAGGQYYIGDKSVAVGELTTQLSALADKNPDRIVYVRADKSVPYGQVMGLLSMVGQAGFYKISLMSEQQGS